jgi:hypothetical protein
MNPRGFLILVVATVVSIAAAAIAVVTAPQYASTAEVGRKVFPDLMEKVDNVARIEIVHPEKTLNIKRQGASWNLAEADNYPAETKRLGKALLGLAQLELFEPKTRLKERYKELWVGDPQKKGGQAKLVTLFDKDGKIIDKIIIGRTKFDVEGSDAGGVYLRRPDEEQSWVAKGELDIGYEQRDWYDRAFLDFDYKRFKNIVIRHPGGEVISVSKPDIKAEHFVLDNMPAGKKLKSEFEVDDIATVFAGFRVDDVKKGDKETFPADKTITAEYMTFDGLKVDVALYVKEGVHWMKFKLTTLPGAAASEAGKVDPIKDVERITPKIDGWIYDVSDYRVSALKKTLKDVLVDIKPGS